MWLGFRYLNNVLFFFADTGATHSFVTLQNAVLAHPSVTKEHLLIEMVKPVA